MDKISRARRSLNMAAIKGTDTNPELLVRKWLYASGYRYRLHKRTLPGNPDIFIKSRNAVINVNGCFWHQHAKCRFASHPKSNRKFWNHKLKKNIKRDKINTVKLKRLGYKVITVWECEIGKSASVINQKLKKKLSKLLKK